MTITSSGNSALFLYLSLFSPQQIQNRFVHGNSLLTGPLDTIGVKEGATTFDLMEIHSTAIQIHRYISIFLSI